MAISGLETPLLIGQVQVVQEPAPVMTQVTSIDQRPGWRPRFVKQMRRIAVGDTQSITMARLSVSISGDVFKEMETWRAEVLGVVGFLAAVLDERVAQRIVLEDLLILDEANEVQGVVDYVPRLRTFQPTSRLLRHHRDLLSAQTISGMGRGHIGSARWYLRGAQLGPTAEAVLFLWIALEGLARPPSGTKLPKSKKRRTQVEWIESALQKAGLHLDQLRTPIGRLADLRSQIVHKGVEEHDLISTAYYDLEMLCRFLIRHRFKIRAGWPISPDANMLRRPLSFIARKFYKRPSTEWQDEQPDG